MILRTFLCPDSCIISVGGTSLLPDFILFTVKVNGASLVTISAGRFSRVNFGGFYWTFLVVRHSKHFRCNDFYSPWIVS